MPEEIFVQIEKIKDFIETVYQEEINDTVITGKKSLIIDFKNLSKFDVEVAEQLLNEPLEVIQNFEMALDQIEITSNKNIRVRFQNLPQTQHLTIRNIRSINLGNLVTIEGIVRQASDVRPQVVSAKFECPTCGNLLSILQLEQAFKEPSRCSCGRKGHFKLVSKDLVDAQRVVLEESPESLEGGEQPKRLSVFLKEDLVEPHMERKTTPGSKVRVIGVVKEVPVFLKTGTLSRMFDLALEASYIEPVQETFEDIDISKKDEKKIIEMSKDPKILIKMVNSIAPSIYGYKEIKTALLLQLLGGTRKIMPDGVVRRGDMHILLVGDPGSGKSALLQFISKIAPKGRFVSGKGATAAGITASVVRDEFLKGWALEAGAMVLANNGIACLHPSTNIICDNKIIPIEEAYSKENEKKYSSKKEDIFVDDIEIKVPSFDLENFSVLNSGSTKIRRKWYKGKLLNIKFDSGFQLKLTPDHKLINGSSLEWKEALEFSKGNYILAPLKIDSSTNDLLFLEILPDNWKVGLSKEEKLHLKKIISSKYKTLSKFNKQFSINRNYLSGGNQFTIKKFKEILNSLGVYQEWKTKNYIFLRNKRSEKLLINKLTPELSYIFGFAIGDGNFSTNKRRSRFNISQSIVNNQNIKRLDECAKIVFGKKFKKYKRFSYDPGKSKLNENYIIYKNSNLLHQLLFETLGHNLEKIMALSNNCLKAFIAGIMDSDGCSSIKHSYKKGVQYETHHVNFFISNDYKTNLNFILGLRRLDLLAKLRDTKNKVLNIEITGRKDVNQLINSIKEYSVKAKNSRLLQLKTKISSTSDKLPSEVVAILSKNISNLNKTTLIKKGIWSTIYNYKNKRIMPSRDQIKKFIDRVGDLMAPEDLLLANNLLRRDFFLDKILDISEVEYDGYVYDLFVPRLHNFLAEGVIVHNCLDELDKINPEDRSALHEAMEQQQISISKANIQATLRAVTTVLAAANPKLGRFDPFTPIASQIELPPTLINRFDLIFPIRDLPNKDKDSLIAEHIITSYDEASEIKAEIEPELFRKYIAYAKQKIRPKLTKDAVEEIKSFYVNLRNMGPVTEDEIKPIPISARQLEGLIRLAEASAKIRLSEKVLKRDAKLAINLVHYSLMQVGFDKETGQIDIDRISTGITASERNKFLIVKDIISRLEERTGSKAISFEDISIEAADKGINEDTLRETIDKLKRSGDVFEPKRGFIQKI